MMEDESEEGDEVLESVNSITQTVNEVMSALSKTAETCENTEPFVESDTFKSDSRIDFEQPLGGITKDLGNV